MEKRKPTYDLSSFKEAIKTPGNVEFSVVAIRDAYILDIDTIGVVEIVQTMEHKHFYKSMTSNQNARVWQDVYHVPCNKMTLYIKFTSGRLTEFKLLSFKEK